MARQTQRLLAVLILAQLLMSGTSINRSIQTYTFRKGSDAVVLFHHTLHGPNSTFSSELFSSDSIHPIYTNGLLMASHLKSGQQGRFTVTTQWNGSNVTLALSISNITEIDKNLYIVGIREEIEGLGQIENYIYDAYVDVTIPPGSPECSIDFCTLNVCEVQCQAQLASDGAGSLHCFQNQKMASVRQPLERNRTHMNEVYWVSKLSPLKCCSFDNETTPTTCVDYEHPFETVTTSSSHKILLSSLVTTEHLEFDVNKGHAEECNGTDIIQINNYLILILAVAVLLRSQGCVLQTENTSKVHHCILKRILK